MTQKSLLDNLSSRLAPIYQTLHNVGLKLGGTSTSILRINTSIRNNFGDKNLSLEKSVIDDVILVYPAYTQEINISKGDGNSINPVINTNAIDLMSMLPVEMYIPFDKPLVDKEKNYDTNSIAVAVGDLIVDLKYDEQGNKIPIILIVTKVEGGFFGKHIIKKKYMLTRHTAILEDELQADINAYLDGIV